jgi:hypothetical protein
MTRKPAGRNLKVKPALVVLLFATLVFSTSAFAQDQSPLAAAEAACGPKEVKFDAHTATSQPLAQPEAGKGLVYVVEEFDKLPGQIARPTLRVGVDGKWAGADTGNSYISFSVDPGEHHLCTNWQSRLKQLSNLAAFTSFTADSGKTYFFRARITEHQGSIGGSTFSLDFESLNGDEGKYLVASSALSAAQPKK